MTDSSIAVAPPSTGPNIDTQVLTNGLSQAVHRQTVTVGSPTDIGSVQDVVAGNVSATFDNAAAVVVLRPDAGGSTGIDFSVNEPTWPNIGHNFDSGSALFPSWALIATVPADPSRLTITADNMDSVQILCIRDDGTAASGALPINSTAFIINPKVTVGPEGGHYESHTFRGRLRFFAATSAFLSISTD